MVKHRRGYETHCGTDETGNFSKLDHFLLVEDHFKMNEELEKLSTEELLARAYEGGEFNYELFQRAVRQGAKEKEDKDKKEVDGLLKLLAMLSKMQANMEEMKMKVDWLYENSFDPDNYVESKKRKLLFEQKVKDK